MPNEPTENEAERLEREEIRQLSEEHIALWANDAQVAHSPSTSGVHRAYNCG